MGIASWLRYCSDVGQRKPTKLCTMFGRLLGLYSIHFRGLLPRDGIYPGAKLILRPSLALSYIVSVTARHRSSEREPNFAAFNRGRHLYSAGWPSCWALTHISSYSICYLSVVYFTCSWCFIIIFFIHVQAFTFLWPPCVADADIILSSCGFFFFFSSPIFSGRRLDVYHTSTHHVVLMQI